MGDTVVGVYCRPPDQEEEADEAFYRQLKVASQSQALVLLGDFITSGAFTPRMLENCEENKKPQS